MEAMRLEDAQRWCSEWESTLRSSFGESRELPPDWEGELAKYSADSLKSALTRWAHLRHFYLLRQQEKQRAKAPDAAVRETARQLLSRDPVRIRLRSGRVVQVTGRSYAAMAEISCHARAITDLEQALQATDPGAELQRRTQYEILLHRKAIWAHALTGSGAPAKSLEESPEWWEEITPSDDGLLLSAALEAGAVRYSQLPDPPAPKAKAELAEDLGWGTLFACIERELKLPPASLFDQDLYQLLTWRRASAPAIPELGS